VDRWPQNFSSNIIVKQRENQSNQRLVKQMSLIFKVLPQHCHALLNGIIQTIEDTETNLHQQLFQYGTSLLNNTIVRVVEFR
jgi:hypothetical protein